MATEKRLIDVGKNVTAKWVTIEYTHVNVSHINTFYWENGKLWIWFAGDDRAVKWKDPNGELYLQLCKDLGNKPCMEDED